MQFKSRSYTILELDKKISRIEKKAIKEVIQNKLQEVTMLENEEKKKKREKTKEESSEKKEIKKERNFEEQKSKSFATTSIILSRSGCKYLERQVSERIKGAEKVMDKIQEIKRIQRVCEEKEKKERKLLAKKLEDFEKRRKKYNVLMNVVKKAENKSSVYASTKALNALRVSQPSKYNKTN
jgi:hypothetical protein